LRQAGQLREADQREFEAMWDARIRKIDDAYARETDNAERARIGHEKEAAAAVRAAETARRAQERLRAEARAEAATQGVERGNALRAAGRYAEAGDADFEADAARALSDPALDPAARARLQREIDSERAVRAAERGRSVGDRIAGARENLLRGQGRNRLADYMELRRRQQRRLEEAGEDPGLQAAAEAENRAELEMFRRDLKGDRQAVTTDMRSFYGGLLESAVMGGNGQGKRAGRDRDEILRDIGKGLDGAAGKLDKAADKINNGPVIGIVDVGAG
jgi:hypothetical protein